MLVNPNNASAQLIGNSSSNSPANTTTSADFAALLQSQVDREPQRFSSGRIEVETDRRGRIALVRMLDTAGRPLESTAFIAPDILRVARRHGIDLTDLRGIGTQLDAAGIGYRPYELYSGSDHGIDFEDLIAGGLGTAYDWRVDPHVDWKGPWARQQLAANQELARQLGLVANPRANSVRSIDPGGIQPTAATQTIAGVLAMIAARPAALQETPSTPTPSNLSAPVQGPVATTSSPTTPIASVAGSTAMAPPSATSLTATNVASAATVTTPTATNTVPAPTNTVADSGEDVSNLLEQLRVLLLALPLTERQAVISEAMRNLTTQADGD